MGPCPRQEMGLGQRGQRVGETRPRPRGGGHCPGWRAAGARAGSWASPQLGIEAPGQDPWRMCRAALGGRGRLEPQPGDQSSRAPGPGSSESFLIPGPVGVAGPRPSPPPPGLALRLVGNQGLLPDGPAQPGHTCRHPEAADHRPGPRSLVPSNGETEATQGEGGPGSSTCPGSRAGSRSRALPSLLGGVPCGKPTSGPPRRPVSGPVSAGALLGTVGTGCLISGSARCQAAGDRGQWPNRPRRMPPALGRNAIQGRQCRVTTARPLGRSREACGQPGR